MNRELVDKIARAVLYEGYILYPYRPSVKNRQRWTFGGLYPKAWSDAQEGTDAWTMQTQCLAVVNPGAAAKLSVAVRFLHLTNRVVGRLPAPLTKWPDAEPEFEPVQTLEVAGKQYQSWQEATEREVNIGEFDLNDLVAQPRQQDFSFPHHRRIEPLPAKDGKIVGVLVREQQALAGRVELTAEQLAPDLLKLTVRVLNRSDLNFTGTTTRDDALMRSFASTHTVLGIENGEFLSPTDPPEEHRDHAAGCVNAGTWPMLVGVPPQRDTLLSAPIILYDYPQIAPESPGDLFDSMEIDEILTLRIMTLTDEEKRAMAGVDERAHALLERTETLARDQLMGLHGTVRALHPVHKEDRGE